MTDLIYMAFWRVKYAFYQLVLNGLALRRDWLERSLTGKYRSISRNQAVYSATVNRATAHDRRPPSAVYGVFVLVVGVALAYAAVFWWCVVAFFSRRR
jgi:hypothetical protein